MAYGTLSISDLVAANVGLQTIVEIGEDLVWQAIQTQLTIHNQILRDLLGDFAEFSNDRLRRYGGVDAMVMDPIDEFGVPDASKVTAGSNVFFPLRSYGSALQWTRLYMEQHTGQEMAAQVNALQDADRLRMDYEIQRALFVPTNYNFTDVRKDRVTLAVKRLLNADGAPVPLGPNGETFNASTHTHYLARAGGSLANTDIQAVLITVQEHFANGSLLLYINQAQEAAVRAMTGNFTPYYDSRLRLATTITAGDKGLDMINTNNRAIGLFDAAEVWVKPWVPANYLYAWMRGGPKPLVIREPDKGTTGLHLAYDWEEHPLRANGYEHQYGIGVWNRHNGAVLYAGNTVYAAPTIP